MSEKPLRVEAGNHRNLEATRPPRLFVCNIFAKVLFGCTPLARL
jgi:hypothetical protein